MTLKVKQGGVFTAVGGGGGGTTDEWVRPADWVALPTVNTGEQKVIGLVTVYEGDSNFVGMQCQGAYTVDWGDGSAPVNFASNALAIKNILWASVPSGTLTTGGYRQAIITITPQAGSNLTSVTLNPTLASVLVSASAAPLWLDVKMAGASVTTLAVSTTQRSARLLQRFEYVGPSGIVATAPFTSASALRSVVGSEWTATQTSFNIMFSGCVALRTIPLLNTASGTNFSNMFNGCLGLRTIPLLDTSAGTNFSSMFNGCTSLENIPLLNTANGTNFANMFLACHSLQTIPLLNTANGLDLSNMFSTCSTLNAIPLLNASSATTLTNIFASCPSLQVGAMAGTKTTISYASCKLSATQLDAIYSNLASGVAGQTITVTGNHGVAGDSPAIATGKGWTVTG